MERQIAIEKYEMNMYSIKSIEYIKGVLHSYAVLNEPESNLGYDYEIIEIDKAENVVDQIKERFYIFEKQPLELKHLLLEEFINFLKKWFFCAGEISQLKIS